MHGTPLCGPRSKQACQLFAEKDQNDAIGTHSPNDPKYAEERVLLHVVGERLEKYIICICDWMIQQMFRIVDIRESKPMQR